jgi:hypothetical protein
LHGLTVAPLPCGVHRKMRRMVKKGGVCGLRLLNYYVIFLSLCCVTTFVTSTPGMQQNMPAFLMILRVHFNNKQPVDLTRNVLGKLAYILHLHLHLHYAAHSHYAFLRYRNNGCTRWAGICSNP